MELLDVEEEWENFLDNENNPQQDTLLKVNTTPLIMPECENIKISTKTVILYLTKSVLLEELFWKLDIMSYDIHKNGIIKKQMKFNFKSKEEVEQFEKNIINEKYKDISILTQIDNPNGRIVFKDVRKVSVGLSKKCLINKKKKSKSAFYNCLVIVYRVKINDKFTEIHIKLFNTGKIEIPGIQNSNTIDIASKFIIDIINNHLNIGIQEFKNKRETILVNSNFNCQFFIKRDVLFSTLKTKYKIKCNYDPCSYPGIQCKFILQNKDEVSFMIFRTGSVLIVGKCEDDELLNIYNFIKDIFKAEFNHIYEKGGEFPIKKIKKKPRVILI